MYPLRSYTYGVHQATGARGRPVERVRHGRLEAVADVPDDTFLEAWAAAAYRPLDGHVVFFDAQGGPAYETVSWAAGHCVNYRGRFAAGNAAEGAYVCLFAIAVPKFVFSVGVPPVAALPFVAGAEGVPRLPRISGAPPFTVKGAKNGKPGLDRSEFARQLTGQLTGQQDGLNRLTVAQFLANRDQYLRKALLIGYGRDPKGDAVQQELRKEALQDKVAELLTDNEALSTKEARDQAEKWLDTQAALHDPNQVAGGHAHLVTGLGDARVNSSIGAQWPKRIKGIDIHIRKYAAGMSQQERETTYLDVGLPMA
jgi:hypothetical protein